jgi:serine protease
VDFAFRQDRGGCRPREAGHLHRTHAALEVSVTRPHVVPLLAAALLTLAAPAALAQTGPPTIATDFESPWQMPGYVPDEILVKFREATPAARISGIVARENASLRRKPEPDGLAWVRLGPGTTVSDAVARWERFPEVEYASPNLYTRALFVPNDSLIHQDDFAWNLRTVGAYGAWDLVHGDPRVILAIIDTGVAFEEHDIPDYERPNVKPGVTHYRQSVDLPGPFVPGWDFVNDDAHPNDDHGHGTMVATIAAGMANNLAGSAGIAWGITLMPIKVLDFRHEGTAAPMVLGLRFAADHGANIANLSLGLPSLRELRALGGSVDSLQHAFNPIRDAINYARQRGVIVVAAAGNSASPDLSLPAAYPGVISVGATGFDNLRAPYSSFGKGLDFVAPGGVSFQHHIFCLGIKPFRSEGSLANPESLGVFSDFGTSLAAPQVSGAVALLMSLGLTDQGSIEQALRATALMPIGHPNARSQEYGFGLIQIDKAVRHAIRSHGLSRARGLGRSDRARILSQNPARGAASLAFRVGHAGPVSVRVFDVRGALVRTLLSEEAPTGSRVLRWDGRTASGAPAPSGLYFFRVETPGSVETPKVLLLR